MLGNAVRPTEHDGSYDASNPQSFNRYAYVLNNPMSDIDPDGEDTSQGLCYLTASSCGAGGGGGGVGGGGTGIGQMQMASNTMWPSSTSEVFIVPTDGETPPHMETQTTSLVSSMSPWLFLTSWVPGGGGGSGGAAPNNPSPCVQSFSNAMALDYSQPIYNGQTTQQHIQSRHMSGVGKQNVSTYWTQDFSAVMHLNFWTFLLGDQTVDSRGMTFELTFPNLRALLTPGSGLQNGIGYDKNGNDTLTNRLATMPDCKTVVTSYPIQ